MAFNGHLQRLGHINLTLCVSTESNIKLDFIYEIGIWGHSQTTFTARGGWGFIKCQRKLTREGWGGHEMSTLTKKIIYLTDEIDEEQ